jgi:hypothetical protein
VGVLAHQAAEFAAIGRTKDEGFAGILPFDGGDGFRIAPGEASVGGEGLIHHEWRLVGAIGSFVIEPEITAVFQFHDAAEGHDAGKAERRHFFPRLAFVLAHDRGHAGSSAFAEGGGPDPDPRLARRIDEPVDAGTILMGRKAGGEPVVETCPGESAVFALRHGAGRATVIDAPHGVDRFAIGHQQGGGMSLIDLRGACGDDDVAIRFS